MGEQLTAFDKYYHTVDLFNASAALVKGCIIT